jgi:hypothetical protein
LDRRDAYDRISRLREDLRLIVERDQEQEVRGIAIPVLDAVLGAARSFLPPGDPIVSAVRDVISPEVIADGEPVRAIDAFIVATQLEQALYIPPASWSTVYAPSMFQAPPS